MKVVPDNYYLLIAHCPNCRTCLEIEPEKDYYYDSHYECGDFVWLKCCVCNFNFSESDLYNNIIREHGEVPSGSHLRKLGNDVNWKVWPSCNSRSLITKNCECNHCNAIRKEGLLALIGIEPVKVRQLDETTLEFESNDKHFGYIKLKPNGFVLSIDGIAFEKDSVTTIDKRISFTVKQIISEKNKYIVKIDKLNYL
jgi:hypothetical protein